MKNKLLVVISLSLFATSSVAVDKYTAGFIAGKAKTLASQGKYDEALAEIAWLLRDSTPFVAEYAEEVLSAYPAVANAQLETLTVSRLTELSCAGSDTPSGKEAALTIINEVARFADSQKVADARARVELLYESQYISEQMLKCEQGRETLQVEEQNKQAELASATIKRAPSELRAMAPSEFCIQYGQTLRGNIPEAYSMVKNIPLLFDAEAKWRRTRIDKNLVKSRLIRIGINQCALYASWGYPKSQNRTVGSWGVHIQHVYGDFGPYVYTENGRVTSWQN